LDLRPAAQFLTCANESEAGLYFCPGHWKT
jgi:hypothetical protein